MMPCLNRLLSIGLLVVGGLAPAVSRAASVENLILQIGNADDDARRLELLRQLGESPDLSAELRDDVAKMTKLVDRWLHERSLYRWFDPEIRRTVDYDFKIAAGSPLYPLARFYRARMLVWVANEYGPVLRYHDVRRKYFDKAVEDFRAAHAAFPANRIASMYLGTPIPSDRRFSAPADAPRWAVLQREGLERLADVVHWWIDHRLQPDGQYGGDWDDDCEMWRHWIPLLFAFEDSKATKAQAFFSNALLSQPYMKGGYTKHVYDVEHTSEPTKDTITPMMHLASDDPQWQARALRIAELARTLWMGRNERGFLQFKSIYFSSEKVDANSVHACDAPYCVSALQPVLHLWQRTADPRLGELITAWMDTWVDAAARGECGKPAGVLPAVIRWPDGAPRGPGENWWDPRNHDEPKLYEWPSAMSSLIDTLLLTWHMTGNEKYLDPMRSMAAIQRRQRGHAGQAPPAEGSEAWCAARMSGLSSALARYKQLSGSTEFDDLLKLAGVELPDDVSVKQRERLEAALRVNAEALRINFPGYTSEVRYTDRVFTFPRLFGEDMLFAERVPSCEMHPDTRLLYSTATGDRGGFQVFPLNAVRWLTPPRDIAALVTRTARNGLTAELYHFGDEPRSMQAEFYLLARGSYRYTLHPDANKVAHSPANFAVSGPRTRISFVLAPKMVSTLEVRPAE